MKNTFAVLVLHWGSNFPLLVSIKSFGNEQKVVFETAKILHIEYIMSASLTIRQATRTINVSIMCVCVCVCVCMREYLYRRVS